MKLLDTVRSSVRWQTLKRSACSGFVYSFYLAPAPDGEHIFDFKALGTPEFRHAFDGEFRVDVVVISGDTLILLDGARAQRLGL